MSILSIPGLHASGEGLHNLHGREKHSQPLRTTPQFSFQRIILSLSLGQVVGVKKALRPHPSLFMVDLDLRLGNGDHRGSQLIFHTATPFQSVSLAWFALNYRFVPVAGIRNMTGVRSKLQSALYPAAGVYFSDTTLRVRKYSGLDGENQRRPPLCSHSDRPATPVHVGGVARGPGQYVQSCNRRNLFFR